MKFGSDLDPYVLVVSIAAFRLTLRAEGNTKNISQAS